MSKIGKTSYSSLTRALHIADTPVTDTPINHYHVVSTIFLSLPPRHQHVSAFIALAAILDGKYTVCSWLSTYVCQLADISPRHQHLWCYFGTYCTDGHVDQVG